jgi:hypothetical protein
LVDNLPSTVAKCLPAAEAKDIQEKLQAIDGVELELEAA